MRTLLFAIAYSFLITMTLLGQEISGIVYDNYTGKPVENVFVLAGVYASNCYAYAKTDSLGWYCLVLDSVHNKLSFSHDFYESKYIDIQQNSELYIGLDPVIRELKEITIKEFIFRPREIFSKTPRKIVFNKKTKNYDTIYGNSYLDTLSMRRVLERNNLKIQSIDKRKLRDSINIISNITESEREFRNYMLQSIEYPEISKLNGIQGYVYIQFRINDKRNIDDIIIRRSLNRHIDSESIRVLKNMPHSIQLKLSEYCTYRGKNYSVYFVLPILFILEEL